MRAALQALTSQGLDLLDGALFVLQSPLSWAAVLATCSLLQPARTRGGAARATTFALVAIASGWPAPASWTQVAPAVLLVILGLAGAWGLRLQNRGAWLAIVLGGIAAGWSGGMQTTRWQEAVGGGTVLGVGAFLLLLAQYALASARPAVARVAQVGWRVVGAWVGTVGALMGGLWLRS